MSNVSGYELVEKHVQWGYVWVTKMGLKVLSKRRFATETEANEVVDYADTYAPGRNFVVRIDTVTTVTNA